MNTRTDFPCIIMDIVPYRVAAQKREFHLFFCIADELCLPLMTAASHFSLDRFMNLIPSPHSLMMFTLAPLCRERRCPLLAVSFYPYSNSIFSLPSTPINRHHHSCFPSSSISPCSLYFVVIPRLTPCFHQCPFPLLTQPTQPHSSSVPSMPSLS